MPRWSSTSYFSSIEASHVTSYLQPGSPHVGPMRSALSIAESVNSSPMNFLGPVPSPDLSGMNIIDSSIGSISARIFSGMATKSDQALAIINCLVGNRPLPEKGRLVQAVEEAGAQLKMLLVTGRLPQWQNPPPLRPLQIPPIAVNPNAIGKFNYLVQSAPPCAIHCEYPTGDSRIHSSSSLNISGAEGLSLLAWECSWNRHGPYILYWHTRNHMFI